MASRCQRPWRSLVPVRRRRWTQTGQRPWPLTRDTGTRRPAPQGQVKRTFSPAGGAAGAATGRVRTVLLIMVPLRNLVPPYVSLETRTCMDIFNGAKRRQGNRSSRKRGAGPGKKAVQLPKEPSAPEDVVQLALRGLAELLRDLLALALALRDVVEQLAELRGDLARVESHHAQRRLVVEDDGEDRALADEGQLDVVLLALVEHDG